MRYAVSTPIWVSSAMPMADSSMPAVTGMRAPIFGSRTAVESVAITMMPPTIGRNAKPVLIGEYISVSCR